jgi:hypothetical protein
MSVSARQAERPETRPDFALGAALVSAVLFGAGALGRAAGLPGLGVLAALSPMPLALTRIETSSVQAWLAALLSAGLVASVGSTTASVTFVLGFALPGLLIGTAMVRGRGLLRGSLWAAAWLTTAIAVWLLFAGSQLVASWLSQLDLLRSQPFLDRLRTEGVALEQVQWLHDSAERLHGILSLTYPAVSVILGLVMVAVNAGLLRAYLRRHDPGWLQEGEFERLRWPFPLVVIFVAASLALVAPALRPLSVNVLLLVAFLFALQGLAVVAYFSGRLVPALALWLAAFTLFVTHPVAPVVALALLGLFDHWLDARRWAEPPADAD